MGNNRSRGLKLLSILPKRRPLLAVQKYSILPGNLFYLNFENYIYRNSYKLPIQYSAAREKMSRHLDIAAS
jgi:hypothetical protein